MDWFYRDFGARVRAARGDAITQQELARRVGLSRSSVANVERGAQRVAIHMISVFADALGVPAEALLPSGPPRETPEITPALPIGSRNQGIDALRLVLRKASQEGGDGQAGS